MNTIKKIKPSRVIKTIVDNTKEHLSDTDKKLRQNNAVLEGVLRDFYLDKSVKSALYSIIKNNNDIMSANALFKAVDVVISTDEEDGN
jgi:hypothetical protein